MHQNRGVVSEVFSKEEKQRVIVSVEIMMCKDGFERGLYEVLTGKVKLIQIKGLNIHYRRH